MKTYASTELSEIATEGEIKTVILLEKFFVSGFCQLEKYKTNPFFLLSSLHDSHLFNSAP